MKSTTTRNSEAKAKTSKPFFRKASDNEGFFTKRNRASAFIQSGPIQTSLTIGQPDDPFEKEADEVAKQVVGELDHSNSIEKNLSGIGIQKMLVKPMPVNHSISLKKIQKLRPLQSPKVQTKCSACEKEEKLHPKSENTGLSGPETEVPTEIETQINNMQGGGQTLDELTKKAMEASFGADLSNVKVHTDSQAVQMSQQLNAHAFTVGSDIFFNEGRYQPQTKMGAGLLAHELTHTVQQGAVVQNKSMPPSSYSQLLSDHTDAHLFANGNGLPTALNEKDLDKLRGQMPDEYTSLQQKLMQKQQVGKVQKKDKSLTIRRCSADGSPCSKTNAATISTAKKAASKRVKKALKKLKASPPSAAVLTSLKRNFGAKDGVAANLPSIISKIETAHKEMLTVPVNCGTKSDGSCKKSSPPCGYTPSAGAHKYVICIDPTLKSGADPIYQLGCVLHEAFHSAFSDFSTDSYSGWNGHSGSSPGYPGSEPLKNADSYTTLVLDLS